MVQFTFDNSGVSGFQNWLLSLPEADRQSIISDLRNGIESFMPAHFILRSSQLDWLSNMPADLKVHVAQSVADCWETRQMVSFQKDDAEDEDDRRDKDFIIWPGPAESSLLSAEESSFATVSIWIRYR